VRRIKKAGQGAAPKPRAYKDADTRKVEESLTMALGLLTDLRHKGPNGELRIKYKTSAQLEDLIQRLSK
jgi:ParB family chromosome partitioning protein